MKGDDRGATTIFEQIWQLGEQLAQLRQLLVHGHA
jgi:hypothetical protein